MVLGVFDAYVSELTRINKYRAIELELPQRRTAKFPTPPAEKLPAVVIARRRRAGALVLLASASVIRALGSLC